MHAFRFRSICERDQNCLNKSSHLKLKVHAGVGKSQALYKLSAQLHSIQLPLLPNNKQVKLSIIIIQSL
jgi:hypothetical protein